MEIVRENHEICKNIEIKEDDYKVFQNYNINHDVSIIDMRTMACVQENQNEEYPPIVLNFADAYIVGGFYKNGYFGTQEEDVCSKSNLYYTITQRDCLKYYYYPNRKENNQLTANGLLYTKNYMIRDDDLNLLDKYIRFDTITCAAVDLTKINCSEKELYDATTVKIQNIYTAISLNSNPEQTVILGAFGCGVFLNEPTQNAKIFKENMKYLRNKKVIFAIPGKEGYNHKTFKEILEL